MTYFLCLLTGFFLGACTCFYVLWRMGRRKIREQEQEAQACEVTRQIVERAYVQHVIKN